MHRLLQLTLDLFDPPPPESASVKPPARSIPVATTPAPQVSVPLRDAIEPARFGHPRANRHTQLGDARVSFELVRARRRTIGFAVGPEGLTVSAPKWVPLYEVESALQKKSGWIVRKLVEARERQDQSEATRIVWKDGTSIPYLGDTVIVVLDPRHGFKGVGAVLNADAHALPGVARHTLHVGLSQQASPEQIRDAVQAWLMRQATQLFKQRLDHFAPKLGVQWRRLCLSSASTRWGTAHTDGTIRLNWRLIHFRLPVIDYVVAHELSHLRVMDHSPRFWETVSTVVPDYAQLRAHLKSDPLPPWN